MKHEKDNDVLHGKEKKGTMPRFDPSCFHDAKISTVQNVCIVSPRDRYVS